MYETEWHSIALRAGSLTMSQWSGASFVSSIYTVVISAIRLRRSHDFSAKAGHVRLVKRETSRHARARGRRLDLCPFFLSVFSALLVGTFSASCRSIKGSTLVKTRGCPNAVRDRRCFHQVSASRATIGSICERMRERSSRAQPHFRALRSLIIS